MERRDITRTHAHTDINAHAHTDTHTHRKSIAAASLAQVVVSTQSDTQSQWHVNLRGWDYVKAIHCYNDLLW